MASERLFRLIIVLGMHRSGTSAVASAMSALGYYAGNQLLTKNYYNQKGYWEDSKLVALNDRLLSIFGHAYDSLDLLPDDFVSHPEVVLLKAEARSLLENKLVQNPFWVFKDPRICHLLTFWQPIFAELQIDVRYVLVFRHPLSVADSLNKRDKFSVQKSLLLWLQHNISAVIVTEGCTRFFVHYDDFLAEPYSVLLRLARTLGLSDIESRNQNIEEYVQNCLTDTLRHSQYDWEDLLLSSVAFPALLQAYRLLLDAFKEQELASSMEFLGAWRQLSDQLRKDAFLLDFLQVQSDGLKKSAEEKNHVITSQLFWRSMEYPEFAHATRLDARCGFSGQTQHLMFDFPLHMDNVLGLRFDISDYPASVLLQSLQILDSERKVIWQWSGSNGVFGKASADLLWLKDNGRVGRCVSIGNDPFVHLNIPEKVLTCIKPGYFFTVEMIVQPLSVYAKELHQAVLQRDQALINHQDIQTEQQVELGHLRQVLQSIHIQQSGFQSEMCRAEAQLAFFQDLLGDMI